MPLYKYIHLLQIHTYVLTYHVHTHLISGRYQSPISPSDLRVLSIKPVIILQSNPGNIRI